MAVRNKREDILLISMEVKPAFSFCLCNGLLVVFFIHSYHIQGAGIAFRYQVSHCGKQFVNALFLHHTPDKQKLRFISVGVFGDLVVFQIDACAIQQASLLLPDNVFIQKYLTVLSILKENNFRLFAAQLIHCRNQVFQHSLLLKRCSQSGNVDRIGNSGNPRRKSAIYIGLDRIGDHKVRLHLPE